MRGHFAVGDSREVGRREERGEDSAGTLCSGRQSRVGRREGMNHEIHEMHETHESVSHDMPVISK